MKREANRALMEDFDFRFDDWELTEIRKYIPFKNRVRIFEISDGDPSVSFALSIIFRKNLNGLLSIDAVNESELGDEVFVRKKTAFSTVYAHGCMMTESLEVDPINRSISDKIEKYFNKEKPTLTILNFCKNKFYTLQIIKKYSNFINDGVILFNNLDTNKDWRDVFENFVKDKKHMVFKNTKGIGLVLPE
jgi:hypothetical protein